MNFAIVVTYNGSKWIEKCFGSLVNSTTPVNIFAIDNGSTDGTPDIIRSKFPSVQVIENIENLGFGKANNIGIRKAYDAGAEYIFMLNQDAWVEPDSIAKLVGISEKHKDFGIVSPMHLNGAGTALDYNFSLCLNPSFCPHLYSDIYLKRVDDKPYEVNFVNAAAWLISRKTIETVGGFSPLFFLYAEDDNYVHRLKYHGYKVGIYPHAEIFHDRFEREPSIHFTNTFELEIRQLILKYSDPGQAVNIYSYLSTQRKRILKELVRMRLGDAKLTTKRYQRIKDLASEIDRIKIKTVKPGQHFL